ncbi:hypothetical protein FOA52_012577 [Chlamydomonas sp. UWO 241]|nr:hypothetical protein FOA52_012577 [Chlamydomonas sp. UWO 241]
MRVVSARVDDPKSALRLPGVAVFDGSESRPPGGFSSVRLLQGDALDAATPALLEKIVSALMDDLPYECRWMAGEAHTKLRDRMVKVMLDDTHDAEQIMGTNHDLSDEKVLQLLTLRGMLAGRVLVQALQKRHIVDYGVNRSSPTAKKRLAVPFCAAGTPSERSEYAQPDVAVVLTHLSYYRDGLSLVEMLDALQKLLAMGASAQRSYYERWRKLSWDTIDAVDRPLLDMVEKLDPSNGMQRKLLFKHYACNMAAIEFWLSFCLLPVETQQFSQRLCASSCHLADNVPLVEVAGSGSSAGGGGVLPSVGVLPDRTVVGFSGTNDNYRLLPLQVKQAHLPEPHLLGTNGKMLDFVLRDTQGYSTLHLAAGWLRLLGRGQTLDLAALSEVTAKIQSCVGGLGQPPLQQQQGRPQQQQQHGQQRREELSARDVLQWVMHNTVQATLHGIAEWSRQGLFFAATKGRPEHVPQEERMERRDMYGASSSMQLVADVVQAQARVAQVAMAGGSQQQEQVQPGVVASASASAGASAGPLASRMDAFVEQILSASQEHGEGHSTVAFMADKECERELEREEEEEEEVECQMPKVTPAVESDWDYAAAFSVRSPTELPSSAGVAPLATGLIAKLQGAVSMQGVPWPATIYAKTNFSRAVQGGEGVQLQSVVALQLFDDDTRFRTAAQKRALHGLVWRNLPAAEELTSMRGKQMLLPRSDLEDACEDDLFLE